MNYGKSGTAIRELDSVAGRDLGAAVQPEEREGGSRGEAGQTDGAAELHQVRSVGSHHHIGDVSYE